MRILIAEDEVEIARALKVLLEKNKCAVDIVHNGKDAWDFVSQGHYDVFAKNKDMYERISEIHTEKAYSPSKVKSLAKKCGFSVLGVYDEFSFNAPSRTSQRIFFVLKCIK